MKTIFVISELTHAVKFDINVFRDFIILVFPVRLRQVNFMGKMP